MSILVTGATGFIGRNLTEELIKQGYTVFAITKSGKKLGNLNTITCDICDYDKVNEIISKNNIETIFHLAALIPKKNELDPMPFFENNARGTLNLLHASYRNNVKNFIYSSTMTVFGVPEKLPVKENCPMRPNTIYGVSKLEGELYTKVYAENSNLNAIILRYSSVYGPHRNYGSVANFIQNSLKNTTITIASKGKQSTDYVYVKDVVNANLLALKNAKRLKYCDLNIGSGKETKIKDLAKKIIKLTNSKSEIKFEGKSPRDFRFYYDISKAKKVLNYKPVPLKKGLKEYIKILREDKNEQKGRIYLNCKANIA